MLRLGEPGGGVGPVRTCDMAELSPECQRKLDEVCVRAPALAQSQHGASQPVCLLLCQIKLLHDMEPGDALLHSRYCFHRGEPFADGTTKLRYSIRYM